MSSEAYGKLLAAYDVVSLLYDLEVYDREPDFWWWEHAYTPRSNALS